jgi:hypothetical protein
MSILALASDTLVGTAGAGQIEYNGQFFGTDSNASRAQMQRITSGTAVASTSGTSIDFTSLPAWVKKITLMLSGISTNGATSNYLIQLGAGSVTTSGYLGATTFLSSVAVSANLTTGFGIYNASGASQVSHGSVQITTMGSNLWVASGVLAQSNGGATITTAGSITLGGTLDRVRITTVNGTDAYDAGSINIMYEG